VFEELGLDVHARYTPEAVLEAARLIARVFLDESGSARDLARTLSIMYFDSGMEHELAAWPGLDDWYGLLDDGIVSGHAADVDADVSAAARELVDTSPSSGRR
jgi:hypothetical protein